MRRIFLGVLLSLFAVGLLQSQAFSQGGELALFEEIPIVTVATRTAQKLTEAPAAITVITADEIARAPYLKFTDLFRNQPGVNVRDMSYTVQSVAIRGFGDLHSSSRLGAFLDGRSIYNPVTQGVWWTHQPVLTEDIDRIEIMRGPNSVLYGFNAYSGIINIVTKDPKETQGTLVKMSMGDNSTQEYFVRVGGAEGDLDYRLSYQRINSQGYGPDNGRQQIDGLRSNAINLRSRYTLSDDTDIEFLVGGGTQNEGAFPRATTSVEHMESDYELIRLNHKFEEDNDLQVKLHRTYWSTNSDGSTPAIVGATSADTDNIDMTQLDFEFQHTFSPLEDHTLVWGANYRRNEARMWLLRDPNNDFNDTILRVFAQDQIKLTDALTYYCGLEWEENKYTGSDWTTRQTLMYNLVDDHYLRGTFAKAVRAHAFVEYFFNLTLTPGGPVVVNSLGNPALSKEVINAYELGYSGSFLDKKLLTDLQLFYYDIASINNSVNISSVGFTSTYQFQNTDSVHSKGIEVAFNYKPTDWLKTYCNYSYLDMKSKGYVVMAQNIPFVMADIYEKRWNTADPKNMFNIGGTFFLDEPLLPDYIDLRLAYVGTMSVKDVQNTTAGLGKVDDYIKLDIKLGKKFLDDKMEVALVGLNLWDDAHYEHHAGVGATVTNVFKVPQMLLATVKYEF